MSQAKAPDYEDAMMSTFPTDANNQGQGSCGDNNKLYDMDYIARFLESCGATRRPGFNLYDPISWGDVGNSTQSFQQNLQQPAQTGLNTMVGSAYPTYNGAQFTGAGLGFGQPAMRAARSQPFYGISFPEYNGPQFNAMGLGLGQAAMQVSQSQPFYGSTLPTGAFGGAGFGMGQPSMAATQSQGFYGSAFPSMPSGGSAFGIGQPSMVATRRPPFNPFHAGTGFDIRRLPMATAQFPPFNPFLAGNSLVQPTFAHAMNASEVAKDPSEVAKDPDTEYLPDHSDSDSGSDSGSDWDLDWNAEAEASDSEPSGSEPKPRMTKSGMVLRQNPRKKDRYAPYTKPESQSISSSSSRSSSAPKSSSAPTSSSSPASSSAPKSSPVKVKEEPTAEPVPRKKAPTAPGMPKGLSRPILECLLKALLDPALGLNNEFDKIASKLPRRLWPILSAERKEYWEELSVLKKQRTASKKKVPVGELALEDVAEALRIEGRAHLNMGPAKKSKKDLYKARACLWARARIWRRLQMREGRTDPPPPTFTFEEHAELGHGQVNWLEQDMAAELSSTTV